MRQALELAVSTLKHVHGSTRDPFVLMALDNIAALTASATKSDGGMEGHADPSSGRSSRASHLSRELEEAGIKPGPSDTRPADVTVEVRALIAFVQSVFDFYNEGHSMPMWIGRDARALLDTYKIGAK